MDDDVEFPGGGEREQTTVTNGFFEREVYLSRDETAAFLRDLADQLEAGSSFTISTADWEIPFQFQEPIEVEVEFSKQQKRELELELEFTEPEQSQDLTVE